MRYIDADALKERMLNYYECVNPETCKSNYRGETLMAYEVADLIEDCIDNAPTADVDEVVRCKDCKHCDIGENEVDAWCDCRIFNISGSEDFYCACGERRNDG